ncbi:MAG: hypothetical protein JWO38_1313, partial [Gemmataceae bacterium]|nr:hypothetical protein [Gemmataceae bacterium]
EDSTHPTRTLSNEGLNKACSVLIHEPTKAITLVWVACPQLWVDMLELGSGIGRAPMSTPSRGHATQAIPVISLPHGCFVEILGPASVFTLKGWDNIAPGNAPGGPPETPAAHPAR